MLRVSFTSGFMLIVRKPVGFGSYILVGNGDDEEVDIDGKGIRVLLSRKVRFAWCAWGRKFAGKKVNLKCFFIINKKSSHGTTIGGKNV